MTLIHSRTFGSLILAMVALLLGACSEQGSIESHLQNARAFMEAEDYPDAEIELKNVLRADGRNSEAVTLMGELYFMQGRFREAFPYLNAGKELAPDNLANRNRLASLLMIAGRPDQARQEAAFVLSADPKDEQAPLIISDSVRSAEAIPEAMEILGKVGITPATLTANAFIDLKRQSLFPAFAKLEQALKLDPEFGPAYTGKYAIAMSQGKLEEATDALRQAAEHSPTRSGMQSVYADHLINRMGDRETAIEYLETVVEKAPDFLPAITRLAELYAQADRMDEARKLNLTALKLDQIDPTAMRLKGMIAASDEKYDEAIKVLTSMLELYPQDIRANYQLALAHIANGESAKARAPLELVSARNPSNFEASVLLATVLSEANDFSGAVITLRRLVASRPDSPEAKLLLAEAYNRQGNYDAALALYEEVDSSMPEDPQLDYLSGLTQLRRENRPAARESFETALQTNPLHLQSVEQLTALDLSERSYEAALNRINASLELATDTPVLHVIKAQILHAMGQSDEAEASFMKALELDENNRTAHILLSRLYLSQDKIDDALSHLNTVLESNPEDVATLTTLAGVYERDGRTSQAREVYDRILKTAPDNLAALNNLAYLISIEDGPTDRAVELAERARVIAPSNPYTADTLGWILYQRGEYRRARALLLDSNTRLPDNAEVNYHIGAANYFLGNVAESLSRLQTATREASGYNGYDDALQKISILTIDPANATPDQVDLLQEATKAEKGDPVALVKLGLIEKEAGNAEQAIARFREALEVAPNNILAQLELALELSRAGKSAEALELAKSASKLEPNDPEVTFAHGKIAYQSGDYTWASSLLSQAVRQLPNRPDAQLAFASAQLATGNISAAREAAERAATLFAAPEQKERASGLAKTLAYLQNPSVAPVPEPLEGEELANQLVAATQALAAGDADSAKSGFESILKDYPDQAEAKIGLARLLAESGESPERAYNLAGESRRTIGNTSTVLAVQGMARYQQNQYRQSAQFFSQISQSDLTSPLWTYYYGMASKQLDEKDRAATLLSKAVQLGLPADLESQANEALASLQN